jgi:hypothetical protein
MPLNTLAARPSFESATVDLRSAHRTRALSLSPAAHQWRLRPPLLLRVMAKQDHWAELAEMLRATLRRFCPRLERLPATTQQATNLLLQAKLEVAVIHLVSQKENFVARLAKPLLVRCPLLRAMHRGLFPVQATALET